MRIALALGSGGARGYAHIGVIAELESRGHEIVAISGASMGALVGGLQAVGRLEEFEHWARGLTQRDVLRLLDFSFVGGGAIRGARIMSVISRLTDGARIEDLRFPYTAVATDLTSRREVWFTRGPLDVAIRASFAIPSVITPAVVGDRLMVDGGVTNPVPMEPLATVDYDALVAVSLTGRRAGTRESAIKGSSDSGEQWTNADPAATARSRLRLGGVRMDGLRDGLLSPLGERIRQVAGDRDVLRALIARVEREIAEWGSAHGGGPESGTASEEVRSAVDRGADADSYGSLPGSLGIFDVVVQSIDTMESIITAYRMAGSRPDVLVDVPADLCPAFDFHRANEVIGYGRALAAKAFDAAGLDAVGPNMSGPRLAVRDTKSEDGKRSNLL